MSEFVTVANVDEVQPSSCRRVEVDGHPVCLVNLEGSIFAVDDMCTHAEASLANGDISGDEILCPLHYASFNIRTGECTGPPADEDLKTYQVRIEGVSIQVERPN